MAERWYDTVLARAGLVRRSVSQQRLARVAAEVEATQYYQKETDMREGFMTSQVEASWTAIQKAASETRQKHGRWPTHVALPRDMEDGPLLDLLADSSLREMQGMTGQGSSIFLGFDRSEHPVKRLPSWMKDRLDEPEVVVEVVEVAAEVSEVEEETTTRQFIMGLIESGEPVVVDSPEMGKELASIMRERMS
jgi:hypothetical protein